MLDYLLQWPFELEKVNQQPDEACFEEAMTYKISSAIKVPVQVPRVCARARALCALCALSLSIALHYKPLRKNAFPKNALGGVPASTCVKRDPYHYKHEKRLIKQTYRL